MARHRRNFYLTKRSGVLLYRRFQLFMRQLLSLHRNGLTLHGLKWLGLRQFREHRQQPLLCPGLLQQLNRMKHG